MAFMLTMLYHYMDAAPPLFVTISHFSEAFFCIAKIGQVILFFDMM